MWLWDTFNVSLEVRINGTAYHPKQISVEVHEVVHTYINERRDTVRIVKFGTNKECQVLIVHFVKIESSYSIPAYAEPIIGTYFLQRIQVAF